MSTATAYIVRLEDAKGEMISHRIFSSRALAEKFVANEPLPTGLHYKIVEREAQADAVIRLVQKGN